MCGIAGILNLGDQPVSADILKRMTDAIAHRGPDGEGFHFAGPIGLGHRRLAVIDLSPTGRQPMQTPDGRYTISYNGELYNFRELKVELEALGHSFHSRSDTEVVLRAIAQWGEKALTRFNGMFAFALWDREKQELWLARDRYGVKPLYYTLQGKIFLFGSEIKALLAHPAYRVQMDREGLLEYFTFQNFFTDRTLFKDVRLLPPASLLRLSWKHPEKMGIESYWDYHFQEAESPRREAEYVDELDALFRQAVSRQLVSDVPVAAYLSGGMDSASITALASKVLPEMKTFTVGFDLHSASGMEISFDERSTAEYLSYLLKTEHYEMVLKAGDMERVMGRLTRHLEEPRVGQSYPNFYAAQLASKFGKVVLSGSGGDELFGGYPWRYYRALVNDNFDAYIEQYYGFWQRLIPDALAARVFSPVWEDVRHVSPRDIFRGVFQQHANELRRPEDYVNHSLYFEAKTFLHGILVMEDKLSMAHGLETRVPFLDNDLVDFAMRVPVKFKLGNLAEMIRLNENELRKKQSYFAQTQDGKVLLRKTMERYIPSEITQRQKQGFSAPDASWFKGESMDYVRRTLFNSKARVYEFLDRETIQGLVTDHLEGRENRRLLIWSLLSIEKWCETFLC